MNQNGNIENADLVGSSAILQVPITAGDGAADMMEKLRDLFPSAFVDGKLDKDALLSTLGLDDSPGPSFAFTWPGWPSPTRTDTFDRYDVPIGGIKWHVKDECFQKSLSAKQSSW